MYVLFWRSWASRVPLLARDTNFGEMVRGKAGQVRDEPRRDRPCPSPPSRRRSAGSRGMLIQTKDLGLCQFEAASGAKPSSKMCHVSNVGRQGGPRYFSAIVRWLTWDRLFGTVTARHPMCIDLKTGFEALLTRFGATATHRSELLPCTLLDERSTEGCCGSSVVTTTIQNPCTP